MDSGAVENRANAIMKTDALKLLKDSYGGYRSMKTLQQDVTVRDCKAVYGLLPVWKYIYRYKEQEYPFYVNGQTGKIVGTVPC